MTINFCQTITLYLMSRTKYTLHVHHSLDILLPSRLIGNKTECLRPATTPSPTTAASTASPPTSSAGRLRRGICGSTRAGRPR